MGKHKLTLKGSRNLYLIITIQRDYWPALFIRILSVLFFLSTFINLGASNLSIENQTVKYSTSQYIEIWENPHSNFDLDSLSNGSYDHLFKPASQLPEPLPTHAYHLAKINLTNNLPDKNAVAEWVLHFSLILTDFECYAVYANGEMVMGKGGFFTPYQLRTFHPTHKSNLARIHLPPGENVTLYIKAKSDRRHLPPVFEANLLHLDEFNESLKNRKQADGVFVGFVLMILVYNLFLFLFNQDRAFIYYSGCLLCIVVFSLYNTGDLFDLLDQSFFSKNPRWTYFFKITVYLFFIAYLAFLRVFLRLPDLLPKWDRIFRRFVFWIVLPFAGLELVTMIYTQFNYNYVDIITNSCTVLFLIVATAFLFPLYKTKDKKGMFIIFGYMAMGIGIVITIINRIQTIEFSTLFFKIGTIIEIIIFSLGLVYRQYEARKLRQQALFDLEKSKIIQAQKEQEAKQLEELDQLKTSFYTNITHEFRTPLTVIMGITDTIPGHEKERQLIQNNSTNLLHLVNQLLDLSKISAGQMEIDAVQADIVPFLKYLTESFYSLAKEKKINLEFITDKGSLLMDFDEVKIQHIINNLLSNALKFTEEDGKISVTANETQKDNLPYLKIEVKDNGIGISPLKIEHIFDRFFQAHDDKSGLIGGTGVGLALTKDLIEVLGGSIAVKSEVSIGTAFTVHLPITNNAEIMPEVELPKTLIPQSEEVVKPVGESSNLDQPLVLVIEDNKDVVTYIEGILQKEYHVLTAPNGSLGVQTAFEKVPDVIISDVMMPKMDGYEVAETLKADKRTSHIPIILLTAKATEADKMKGLQAGADAYLMKPFNKTELLIRLDNLVKLRKELQAHYNAFPKIAMSEESFSTHTNDTSTSIKPSLEDQFIQKLHDKISDNMDDSDLSINDLCQSVDLSHSQLYRKLKALTGKTPIQFIRSFRLHKAHDLLQNSQLNVSEIAYQVGFNDPNYFSRTYLQEFGQSPTEARK